VMRPTICSLFEPHYKQNLYANPKRTAKWFCTAYLRYNSSASRSKHFFFFKDFPAATRDSGTLRLAKLHVLQLPPDPPPVKGRRRFIIFHTGRSVNTAVWFRDLNTRAKGVRP